MSSCQRFFCRPCCLEVRALVSSGFHLATRFDHLEDHTIILRCGRCNGATKLTRTMQKRSCRQKRRCAGRDTQFMSEPTSKQKNRTGEKTSTHAILAPMLRKTQRDTKCVPGAMSLTKQNNFPRPKCTCRQCVRACPL